MKDVYKKYLTRMAIIWAGCLLLFVLIYMLVLAPEKKSRRQFQRQLTEKKHLYESALKMAREETKTELREQIKLLRDKLSNFVSDFEGSANLTFDISQVANEIGIVPPPSIKVSDKGVGLAKSDREYISENLIELDFAAGFNEFAAFLNALERHQPVFFVDDFMINRSETENSAPHVSMQLVVFAKKRQNS